MTTTDRPAPWAIGQRPSVRITDQQMSDDLKLLIQQHGSMSAALRTAIRLAAAETRDPQPKSGAGMLVRDRLAERLRRGHTTAADDRQLRDAIRNAMRWRANTLTRTTDTDDIAYQLADLLDLTAVYGATYGITHDGIAEASSDATAHSGSYTRRLIWHPATTIEQETR